MNNIMIGKELKKYTLENYEEFCKDALVMPPFEDDEQLEEWFDTHKVHTSLSGHRRHINKLSRQVYNQTSLH